MRDTNHEASLIILMERMILHGTLKNEMALTRDFNEIKMPIVVDHSIVMRASPDEAINFHISKKGWKEGGVETHGKETHQKSDFGLAST